MSKRHVGSSLDGFLKDEGIFDEAQAQAVKEVVAWQSAEAKGYIVLEPVINSDLDLSAHEKQPHSDRRTRT